MQIKAGAANSHSSELFRLFAFWSVFIAVFLLLVSPLTGFAQAKPSKATASVIFDHFKTGFPLLGAHTAVPCESCHLRGVFKGTPTKCASCHNGVIATGKPQNHIPTSEPCSNCHNPNSKVWDLEGGFNHNGITGNCISCHNGVKATGKGINHIKTSDKCEACHANTRSWQPVLNVDHNEVQGTCSSCHNNRLAQGKGPNHIQTNQECDSCHKSTKDWSAAAVDHSKITSNCATCHSKDKPSKHFPTTADCSQCHKTKPLEWDNAGFDHALANGKRCDSCHNGSFIGAVGKHSGHIATAPGQDCKACHTTQDWSTVNVDHSTITAPCATCHAAAKGAKHFPTPANSDCGVCHRVNPLLWSNATFDHSSTTSTCVTCHNGNFPPVEGKNATHIVTTNKCESCHLATDWKIVNVDHTQITNVTKCSTCHAQAAVQVKHFPVPAGQECSTCHSSATPLSWSNATFDHATVATARCDSCHNGSFGGAEGKGGNHIPIPAGQDCKVCHVARSAGGGWALASVFNHGLVSTVSCLQCHNGTFVSQGAVGKSAAHIRSTDNCALCHRVAAVPLWNDLVTPLDHTQVLGSCSSCHLNDKQATHIPVPAGTDCGACHGKPPATWAIAALFNHSLVTAQRCDACHNGAFVTAGAVGKNVGHPVVPAGVDCSVCHKSTASFTTNVIFDHTGITGNCASCHALDKPATHIPVPAGTDCGACHGKPPATWAIATLFNHSLVTTQSCTTCHNGAFVTAGAVGVPAGHFVTTADCKACHTTTSWATIRFLHTSANYPGDHNPTVTCQSCHTTNTQVATWRNAALKPFCAGCHQNDFDPGSHPKIVTPSTNYTAVELKDCAGACHEYTDATLTVIANRNNGPEHRPRDGGF